MVIRLYISDIYMVIRLYISNIYMAIDIHIDCYIYLYSSHIKR